MKPNKRQSPGPERPGGRTGGGRAPAEGRPESRGQDTAQGERLEKEQEILGGRETETGAEGTDPDVEREG